jgi:hypothetical protein
VISRQTLPGAVPGVTTPTEFWSGATPPVVPAGGFRFAEIPADGIPERVLERIAVLRGA